MKIIRFLFCFTYIHSMTLPEAYKLTHPLYNPGLFSVFNTVLGVLDYYETSPTCEGLEVDFGDQGLFYDSAHGANWWEYYFEPVRLKKKDGVEFAEKFPTYKKINFSITAQFMMSRERGNELIQKYVHLKPHVQKKLDSFVEQHFKNNTIIGVHYRGTDKKSEAPTLSYEEVATTIKREMESGQYTKIFIATDDENFVTFMREKFPEKIICLDAIRSCNGTPVHYPSSQDMYKKGEDAVIDCLLLVRCSKLYKMASNLSDTSVKFNPNMPVINLNISYSEKNEAEYYDMFKTLNRIIALLNQYEHGNLDMSVDLPTYGENYADQKGLNWWQYHFLPLSISEEADKKILPLYMNTVFGLANMFEMPPTRAHELIARYVRIKSEITALIDQFVHEKFEGRSVLGVYYLNQGKHEFLQQSLAHEDVLNEVERATKAQLEHTPFVVTNDQEFFTKARNRFPAMIFYHEPVTFDEKQNRAEIERLDLILCILLSRTNRVVGTSSDLLKVVSQFNPTVPVKELDTLWLEKK